jgi:hypothetical protein
MNLAIIWTRGVLKPNHLALDRKYHPTSVLTMTKFLLNSKISTEAANFGFKSKENLTIRF